MVNGLVSVSVDRLQELPRAEIDMLMMSDWTIEGNCLWLDWIQRVLSNQATHEFTSFGALLADYYQVMELFFSMTKFDRVHCRYTRLICLGFHNFALTMI